MDVDFNNMRIQMAHKMNRLIDKLNHNIIPKDNDDYVSTSECVVVPVRELEGLINDIRGDIWILCCMFDKDGDFKEVWEEVGDMPVFNPQEDEEN